MLGSSSVPRFAALLAVICTVTRGPAVLAQDASWGTFAVGADVEVVTTKGRIARGQVDSRTTPYTLWLKTEIEGMSVGSVHNREDVLSVHASSPFNLPPTRTPIEAEALDDRRASGDVASDASSTSTNAALPSRVRALHVFAQLANWDADAEPDGLRLQVMPIDHTNDAVRAAGALTARLTVYRGASRISKGTAAFEEWSVEIRPGMCTDDGVTVELPFRKLAPETDADLHACGQLHVQLNVPSQGSFEAVQETVWLRSKPVTHEMLRRARSN